MKVSDVPEALRHRAQNRHTAASKLRRNERYCPVCLARLKLIASRGRRRRNCVVCRAQRSGPRVCRRCRGADVWENKTDAACRGCGLHGPKWDVSLCPCASSGCTSRRRLCRGALPGGVPRGVGERFAPIVLTASRHDCRMASQPRSESGRKSEENSECSPDGTPCPCARHAVHRTSAPPGRAPNKHAMCFRVFPRPAMAPRLPWGPA